MNRSSGHYKIVRPWARVSGGGLICECNDRFFALIMPHCEEALVLGAPAYLTGQGQNLQCEIVDAFTTEEQDWAEAVLARTQFQGPNEMKLTFYKRVCESAGKDPLAD